MTRSCRAPTPFASLARIVRVAFAVLALILLAPRAPAQIVADPSAPGTQRPTILAAPNGVPLVNIQTPSAAGVSRNTYRQFDVQGNGAILNNSGAATQTQLGGWVQGNPWMTGTSARIILNEVNSNKPTLLQGGMEVAGPRAQVVVANPSGITCDGCGFINASRGTLSTGVPVFGGQGSLDGWQVNRGSVNIFGRGMDASTTDHADILARHVRLNASLWASRLNVLAGSGQSAANSAGLIPDSAMGTATPGEGTPPAYLVDVAELGGMYAGHIFLKGTEAGLGVRNAGKLVASADLMVTIDGRLENRNTVQTGGNLQVQAQSLTNSGKLLLAGDAHIAADEIDNAAGVISAGKQLIARATNLANQDGAIGGQDVQLQLQSLDNRRGVVLADRDLRIDTQGLVNGKVDASADSIMPEQAGKIIAGRDLDITLQNDLQHTGLMQAGRALRLQTPAAVDNRADLLAGESLLLRAGRLTNAARGRIDSDQVEIHTNTDAPIVNRGLIDGGDVFINGRAVHNLGSGRLYGDRLAIKADHLLNAGTPDDPNAPAPVIAARERLDLGLTRLDNRDRAQLLVTGDLQIGGDIAEEIDPVTGKQVRRAVGRAQDVNNDSATVEVTGDATVRAVRVNNRNTGLQIVDKAEPSFFKQTVTPTGTPYEFPASQCLSLYGNGEASCIVHPDRYGKRAAVTPVRTTEVDCSGENGCAFQDRTHYSWNDPIFQRFNVTPVAGPPPAEPDGGCTGSLGDGGSFPLSTPACNAWRAQSDAWNGAYQASLDRLQVPVNAYNSEVNEDNRVFRFEDYTLYSITGQPTRSVVARTAPSVFRVGGDLRFEGDGSSTSRVTNQDSHLLAGRDVTLTGTALDNLATRGTYRVDYSGTWQHTTIESCGTFGSRHCREWHAQNPYNPAPSVTSIDLPTVTPLPGERTAGPRDMQVVSSGPVPSPVENSLFRVAVNRPYLIETDPAFTRYRQWLGSDYLLNALQHDPSTMQKRLGDGFHEQKLLREQVAQLTGRRFLEGYSNDEAQYLALMQSGATFARQFQLVPGVALSGTQMAQLTSDIVWLVKQDVSTTGPDGKPTRAKVLVPRLYVRVKPGDLDGGGSLLTADSIQADLSGALTNSGTIAGRRLVRLAADKVDHTGSIRGGEVDLRATGDIRIEGGTVRAETDIRVVAGRDLNIASTVVTTQTRLSEAEAASGSAYTRTAVDRVASLYVSGGEGMKSSAGSDPGADHFSLQAVAGRNLVTAAAQVGNASAGRTKLSAGQDLNLGSVTNVEDNRAMSGAGNHSQLLRQQESGTRVETQGHVQLNAGQDVMTRAATVRSEAGGIAITAGRDWRVASGEDRQARDDARQYSSSGIFSSSATTLRDSFDQTAAVASTVSGRQVTASAGRDATVQGSVLIGDGNTQIQAGRDLTIAAASNTSSESHFRDEKKSGVFGSGGAGITFGARQQTTESKSQSTTASAATVGSVSGTASLHAGQAYRQTGSDVMAPTGNVDIQAQQVSISEARESTQSSTQSRMKQSGVTVAVSNPLLSAAQTAEKMAQAASDTSDSRMKALAAANVAMAASQARDAIKLAQAGPNGGNPLDQIGGVQVSISVGSASSQSSSQSQIDSSRSATVSAGQDLSITAKGAGANSNLVVQGSQLTAGGSASLQAEGNLQLQASRNTASQTSDNRSSSGSIGVSLGSTGAMVTASGSRARGDADGSDISWTPTVVTAGQRAQISSGADTALRGAVVSAPMVKADVGGALVIESLQDKSDFRSRQQSISGSIGVGADRVTGNIAASNGKIDSRYAGVAEQSGIKAGDGGFEVLVDGQASLQGGVISSTEQAVQSGRNRFASQGVALSDVNNSASHSANSVGINVGTATNPAGTFVPSGTSIGIGSEGDDASSVTRAGISGISGNKEVRTGQEEAALARIFNANRVQREVNAQVAITQTFGNLAPKAVADFAQGQAKKATEQGEPAEAAKWAEGGAYRVALQTAVGGLAGGAAGAAGAGVAAAAAPSLNQIQEVVASSLKRAGAGDAVADAASKVMSGVAAAGLGAVAGDGTVAGVAGGLNVDANNRQLHVSTYLRLREGCQGSSSSECQTINRMGGVRSGTPADDARIPASKVVENYDAEGKVVSYTLVDRKTNQPTMIMEPLEFAAYRNAPAGMQALMPLAPQYVLDFASAGLYSSAGDNKGAVDHVISGVTSRDYARDVALGAAGVAISSVAIARPAGLTTQAVEHMTRAANAADRGGLSVAGRALQKHGDREGSVFPSAKGNPSEVNQQGQQIVTEILNNPSSTVVRRSTGRFGNVTDIVAPDGRGVRYDGSGKFIGFLEPPRR